VPAADVAKLKKAPSFNTCRNVDDDERWRQHRGPRRRTRRSTDGRAFSIASAAPGKYFVYVVPDDDRHCPAARSPTSR
jgi:hypothetical protein